MPIYFTSPACARGTQLRAKAGMVAISKAPRRSTRTFGQPSRYRAGSDLPTEFQALVHTAAAAAVSKSSHPFEAVRSLATLFTHAASHCVVTSNALYFPIAFCGRAPWWHWKKLWSPCLRLWSSSR